MKIKETRSDRVFNIVNITLLLILLAVLLYPLYLVLISSLSDPEMVSTGKVLLYPRGVSFTAYEMVFRNEHILRGYAYTMFYTIFGTAVNLLLTLPAAYALTKRCIKGRTFILMAITLTMYFSGGMIPSYLNIRNLHLLNTVWAIILPGAINTFNLILAKTFFGSIPAEIEDAALIDGASVTKMFLRIILPISKAMVGVIMLYYLVSRWNTYYYALLYLSSAPDKYPLQMVLREILINNIRNAQLLGDSSPELAEYYAYLANQIKYSVIVVAAVPMLILYPFLQKFFDKGVMLGSVKG